MVPVSQFMLAQEQELVIAKKALERLHMGKVSVHHAQEETGWTIIADYEDSLGMRRRAIVLRWRRTGEMDLERSVELAALGFEFKN